MVLQGFHKSLPHEAYLHLTDFFKQKQDVAQALSAQLNNAYQTLLYPLSRAEYILELNQLPMSESDQVNDTTFMSHVMDAREDGESSVYFFLPRVVVNSIELLSQNAGQL